MCRRLPVSFLLLFCLCAQTPAAEGEGRGEPEVVEVEFVGNDAIASGRIQGRIATKPSNRFLFWGSTRTLDSGAVEEDLRRIRSIYQRDGFWAVDVSSEVIPVAPGEVKVRFVIDEGPPSVLRSLLIDGMQSLPREVREEVLSDPPLQAGERWTEEGMKDLEEQIVAGLRREGHATARLEKLVEIAPEEGIADMAIQVEPGEVYEFGDIEIDGNQLVPDRRILGAVLPVLEPGDRFEPRLLREAEAEVFALGVFSSVRASEGEPDPDTRRVPVRLSVAEADFLRLRLGVGAGIEQSYQQVRATADFSHLDVFGGLQRLDFRNEIGYRFLFGGQRSGVAGSTSVQLTQPDIFGNRVDLATRILYERQLTQSFQSNVIGGRIGFPIRLRRWLYFTPGYIIERYFGVEAFATPGFSAQPLPPVNCPGGCTFSYLEQSLILDRRSDPLEPRSGWYASLGLQQGGGPLGGSFTWLRFLPEARAYLPISPKLILALRLQAGILQPLGDEQACAEEAPAEYDRRVRCSPVVVRFYGGGAAGFRGVGAGRLSPLFVQETTTRGGEERIVFVPLGGNSLSLATTELRWFFAENWGAVTFLDAGNVGAGSGDAFRTGDLQYALGLGLRYLTPVGPARLDVGYRFLHRNQEVIDDGPPEEKNFIDWFALFLSIGEAF